MKLFRRIGLLSVVGLLGVTLGVSPVSAIADGRADGNDHPNVGIMYIAATPLFYGFCSGSLLSPHEFLTAGHCTMGLDALGARPDQVFVSFDEHITVGADFAISSAHPIAVTGWVTHPGWTYSAGIIRNDVGIIHLAQDVQLRAIDVPEVGFLDTQAAQNGLQAHEFVNVGYGFTGVDRAFTNRNASVSLSDGRRASATRYLALTGDALLQANSVCGGDSGGPHFYGGSSPNLVVATTSTGAPSCQGATHSQRLDTRAVHDWLELYR